MTRNIVYPQVNICGSNSLSPPRYSFFLILPFSKFGTESPSPAEMGCWYCGDVADCYQSIWPNSYFIFICIQMNIKACTFFILFSERVSSYMVFKIFFFILVFISLRNSYIFLQLFLDSHWNVFHKITHQKIICQKSWKGSAKEFV